LPDAADTESVMLTTGNALEGAPTVTSMTYLPPCGVINNKKA
jgi:hypothetical protein